MRKEKTRCVNQHKSRICILNSDNTLSFHEDFGREGGPIILPECAHNAMEYLDSVDSYLQAMQNEDRTFYDRVMKMLDYFGFKYEPWKAFIRASDAYIWEPVIEMTKEEIEAALGYKIKIKEANNG